MLKIGIIGAENSHTAAIAALCNIDRAVSARVTHVWGETAAFAKAAAEKGQIPTIVRDWRKMLGHVDGIMIDHRHAKYHAEPARFYIQNKVPTFVDKPFTFSLREGKALSALAKRTGTPLTSFSTIPLQRCVQDMKKALRKLEGLSHLVSSGPCDLKSKYGGITFYGIHQVDTVIELLGTGVTTVQLLPHPKGGVAVLTYRDGPMVTLNLLTNGNNKFRWQAIGGKEVLDVPLVSDEKMYLTGLKMFVKMFQTGKEPLAHERMLAPVAVLEALMKSQKTRGPVKVPKLD